MSLLQVLLDAHSDRNETSKLLCSALKRLQIRRLLRFFKKLQAARVRGQWKRERRSLAQDWWSKRSVSAAAAATGVSASQSAVACLEDECQVARPRSYADVAPPPDGILAKPRCDLCAGIFLSLYTQHRDVATDAFLHCNNAATLPALPTSPCVTSLPVLSRRCIIRTWAAWVEAQAMSAVATEVREKQTRCRLSGWVSPISHYAWLHMGIAGLARSLGTGVRWRSFLTRASSRYYHTRIPIVTRTPDE